jgi:hypothetical protein
MNRYNPLSDLKRIFDGNREEIELLGVSISIVNGPDDREPSASWIDLENPVGTGQLVVWSDGQANASFQDFAQEEQPLIEYFESLAPGDLDQVLKKVISRLTKSR